MKHQQQSSPPAIFSRYNNRILAKMSVHLLYVYDLCNGSKRLTFIHMVTALVVYLHYHKASRYKLAFPILLPCQVNIGPGFILR